MTRQQARTTSMTNDATSSRHIKSSSLGCASVPLSLPLYTTFVLLSSTWNMAPTVAALPVLKSIQDCSDFSKTVEPFIDQFYQLPGRLVASIGSIEALHRLYVETNPLVSGFSASLFLAGVFLIVSEINRNYSQVDRLWSILPNLYIVHLAVWARSTGLDHTRIDMVALFSTAWSVSNQVQLLSIGTLECPFLTCEFSRFA